MQEVHFQGTKKVGIEYQIVSVGFTCILFVFILSSVPKSTEGTKNVGRSTE